MFAIRVNARRYGLDPLAQRVDELLIGGVAPLLGQLIISRRYAVVINGKWNPQKLSPERAPAYKPRNGS